jgi:hypothetical protein
MTFLPFLALLAAVASPVVSPLGLGELPPQSLAKGSCALFLWDRASQQRVVMATAAPAQIVVMRGGKPVALPRADSSGSAVLGFAPHAIYGEGSDRIAIDITVVPAEGGGGVVRDGAITVIAADGSSIVAPVAGIIGCS